MSSRARKPDIRGDSDPLLDDFYDAPNESVNEDIDMDWCCLPQLLSSRESAGGSPLFKKKDSWGLSVDSRLQSAREAIDLLSDEGSDRQNDLWRLMLEEKLSAAKSDPDSFYDDLPREATYETALQSLTAHYTMHGLTNRIPTINQILTSLQPFTEVIATMVGSNPGVAGLVWASVQLMLLNISRFIRIFEETGRMLQDLGKALPRFHRYTELLHTPRLHYALRDVYDVYIDFSFVAIRLLRSNVCNTMMRVQWSGLGRQFDDSKRKLLIARAEFESEANLANVEVQTQRHLEVLSKLPISLTSGTSELVSTVVTPRNIMFTGRDDVLLDLHAKLMPSFSPTDSAQRSRCSCLIHAIGGMGKTETMLEYTYRFGSCYSHIFWLRAETNANLVESFVEIVEKLGLEQKDMDVRQKIKVGLDWLQSTTNPWLLAFDNADDPAIVRGFWPAGVRGTIIITSQNPEFVNFAQSEIKLQPMEPKEGRSLIQRYLKRGASEQAEADALSRDLGGLPLAIAHFAGYVAKSQCTIQQILDSYRQRYKSSQIWDVQISASTSEYGHTLATVWDLAWRRLSSDSVKLIELIAFLNPDSIPEEMFIGDGSGNLGTSDWKYWDTHRFNEAIRILRERHLIERDNRPGGACLRTHRSLQRSILQRLDKDVVKRQGIFDEVVDIVRKAFPQPNLAKRGDTSLFPLSEKYLPQVLSINTAFRQSDPRIKAKLVFPELLYDAGFYSFQNALQPDGIDLAETGKEVCEELLKIDPIPVRSTLANLLGILSVYFQWFGMEGRERALELAIWALKLREENLADVPVDEWTQLDCIQMGRSLNDLGCAFCQTNKMDRARAYFDRSLECYDRAGGEESIPTRFGLTYVGQQWVSAKDQDVSKTRDLARRSIGLISQAVGPDTDLLLYAKFNSAVCAFNIGDIDYALQMLQEVYEIQLRVLGATDHQTLASQYNLAVAYQNSDNLEAAERHLRQNVEANNRSIQWRKEDMARAKFRLSIVVRAQNRPVEAAQYKTEALQIIRPHKSTETSALRQYTDRDDMELLDLAVSISHGRTTWSVTDKW